MNKDTLEFLIGGFFVGIYAFSRFSNTRKTENVEVSSRYISALIVYILVALLVFFLLWLLITTGIAIPFLGLAALLEDYSKAFDNPKISAQLLAALLMTEALPRIKAAAAADNQLRILFQRMASLSSSAQSLSSKFRYEALVVDDEHITALEREFIQQELSPDCLQIEDATEPNGKTKHIWTRISLLWIGLNRWERLPDYRAYLNSHADGLNVIKSEFTALSDKVKYCFKLSEAGSGDPVLKKALQDCASHYNAELKKHLQRMADFMSCALLSAKKGTGRMEAITRMGFTAEYNQGIGADLLTLIFILILLIMLISFGLSQWVFGSNGGVLVEPRRFLIAILVASVYSIGIVCAIMAKRHCDREGKVHNAWATYFIAGLGACLLGGMVSIVANTFLNGWNVKSGVEAFAGMQEKPAKWPWQILVFTTTFVTAWLLNENRFQALSALKRRVIEGGIMAGALNVGLFVAGNLMQFSSGEFLWRGMFAAVIGFSIGFFIPAWYRGASHLGWDTRQRSTGDPAIPVNATLHG